MNRIQKRLDKMRKNWQKQSLKKAEVKAVLKDIKSHFNVRTIKKDDGGWPLNFDTYRTSLIKAGADDFIVDSLIYAVGLRIKYCPKRMHLVIVK